MVEWENKPLLECVDLLQGLTYSPSNVKSYGTLVLRSSNIKSGKLDFNDCVYVDCNVDENKFVKPSDILICVRNGSSTLIGKNCVIDKPYNATFGAFMSVLRGDSTGYIAHIFASDIVQSQIRNRSSATINQITKRDFEDIVITIPTETLEQRRIAEALSDMDSYIVSLEKLISKKRSIKQGTMQELLTGKRRLEGFTDEWVNRTLGDGVLRVGHGKNQHNIESQSGKYPILATSGEIGRTDFYLYDKLSVLIGRKGTIDKPQYMETPFWTIDTLFYTLISDDNVAKYIYYLFCTIEWSCYNEASGVPSLSAKIIEGIEVIMPPMKDEQIAIVQILSDMDAEIDALTAKLTKLKNIKQGMMSELLTGRIRLKEDSPSGKD